MLLADVYIGSTVLESNLATCSGVRGVGAVLPVLLLDMSFREIHVCVHRDTCISMFFAKLFVIEEIGENIVHLQNV